MCGRFAIDGKVNEAISEYVHAGGKPQDWRPSDWAPNYNVAPTNPSVIIRDRVDATPERSAAKWTGMPSETSAHHG